MPTTRPALAALLALSALLVILAVPALAVGPRVPMASVLAAAPSIGDLALGSPDAPVTVVEYTSTLCPYCGKFRREAWPGIRAAYVDTGKVRWIVREFPIANADYAGFLLARCEGNDAAPGVIDTMFGRQRDLALANGSSGAFVAFAGLMGIPRDRVAACMARAEIRESLDAARKVATDTLGVGGTPTFFVAGERIVGEVDRATMAATLDRAGASAR